MTPRLPLPAPRALRSSPLLALAVAGVAGLAALAPTAARADAAPAEAHSPVTGFTAFGPIRPVVGALVTGTAGNDPNTVINPDGSTASGVLGKRYQVFAGAEFAVAANGLKLRLTGGLQTGDLSTAAGSEHFTRVPLEATLLYPLNDTLRVGGGVRYAARLRFSGPGGNTSDDINASPSVMAVADYRLFEHLLLDVRYVYERYQSTNGDLEGSHFGIGATAQY